METEPPEAEPAGGTLPDCLVGNWVVSDAELNAYYDAVAANIGDGAVTFDTVGTPGITFTETEYVYSGDFTLILSLAGQTGSGVATGSAIGNYTVEDGIIRSELVSSDLGIIVTVGGATLNQSDLGNAFLDDNPLFDTPASCDGPTLMFASGADGAIRHPIVLTPA